MELSKISIIVPIYNVEKYLARCIESLINQTYTNIEIILVDDGSYDNSPFICDKYAYVDSRITVLHKENGGLSDARNSGLEVARGEYLTFIDSDDYVKEDYILNMQGIAKRYNADLVQCAFELGTNDTFKQQNREFQIIEYTKDDKFKNSYVKITAWAKLYKRKLFDKTRFPKGHYYEDDAIAHILLYNANKLVIYTEPMYYYYQSPESIMRKQGGFNFYIDDFLYVYHQKFDFFKSLNEINLLKHTQKRFCIGLILAYIYCYKSKNNKFKCPELYSIYLNGLRELDFKDQISIKERLLLYTFKLFPSAFAFTLSILKIKK